MNNTIATNGYVEIDWSLERKIYPIKYNGKIKNPIYVISSILALCNNLDNDCRDLLYIILNFKHERDVATIKAHYTNMFKVSTSKYYIVINRLIKRKVITIDYNKIINVNKDYEIDDNCFNIDEVVINLKEK